MFVLYKPKALLSIATGGFSSLIPGLQDKPNKAKVPGSDQAAKEDTAAADEAARKMRAREKLRAGVQSTLGSGTTAAQFAQAGGQKRSLLG